MIVASDGMVIVRVRNPSSFSSAFFNCSMADCRWISSSFEYSETLRRFSQRAVLSNSVSQVLSVAAASTASLSTSVMLMKLLFGNTTGGGCSFARSAVDASRGVMTENS